MKRFNILKSTIIIVSFFSSLFTSSLETLLKPTPDIKAVEFNDAIVRVPSQISFDEVGHLLEASSIIKEQLAFKGQTLQLPISIKEYRLLRRFLPMLISKKMDSLTGALDSLDYKTLSSLITISDKLSIEKLLDQTIDVLIAKLEKNYGDFFAENFFKQFEVLTPPVKQYIVQKIINKQKSDILQLVTINFQKKELPQRIFPENLLMQLIEFDKIVILFEDNRLEIRDLLSGNTLFSTPFVDPIIRIKISPDNKQLALLHADGTLRILHNQTQKWITIRTNLDIHPQKLHIIFSPDSSKIALSYNSTIYIYDSLNGNVLHTLNTSFEEIKLLKFSGNNQLLVASNFISMDWFDVENGTLVKQFTTTSEGIVIPSYNGNYFAWVQPEVISIYDAKDNIINNIPISEYIYMITRKDYPTYSGIAEFSDDNQFLSVLTAESGLKTLVTGTMYLKQLMYNLTPLFTLERFLHSKNSTFEQALLFNAIVGCKKTNCRSIDFSSSKDIFNSLPENIRNILLNQYALKITVSSFTQRWFKSR